MQQHVFSCALVVMVVLLWGCSGDDADSARPEVAAGPESAASGTPAESPKTASVAEDPAPVDLDAACPDKTQTVVGLCLGMSVAEVEAAIKAHAPEMPLRKKQSGFRYSDGVQQLSTDPYVSEIQAESNNPDEGFAVTFTAPPGEPRAAFIQRWQGAEGANLPPIAKYAEALIGKYGNPAINVSRPQGSMPSTILRWLFPADGTVCSDEGLDEWLTQLRMNPGFDNEARLRESGIAPSDCAKVLQIRLTAPSPDVSVTHFSLELSDPALAATSSTRTLNWMVELEEGAKRTRLENAEPPKL